MSQSDPPASPNIDQSQQRGGLSLGAFNQFKDVTIGDTVAGDKITNEIFQLIVYTGPDRPVDPAARRDLEQAYRSEVALRYAVWRTRYATLPMQARVQPTPGGDRLPLFEREDFVFQTLGALIQPDEPSTPPKEAPAPVIETFTDLREGLRRYQDLLLLAPPGGGKTTALWRLALDLAQEGLSDPAQPLPVFVRLGGLDQGTTVEALLRRELAHATLYDARKRPIALPAHRQLAALLPDLLASGRLVLLWDGLNETPTTLFGATAQALAQFCDRYPRTLHGRNVSITTCRAEDFAVLVESSGGESPLPVQQVTLLSLSNETTEALVVARLGAERGRQLLTALAEPQHQGLRSLVRTPLLLTMLCEVFARLRSVPTNRGKLLEAFVQTRWHWERQRQPERWISQVRQQKILAVLAFAMTDGYGRGTSVSWDWAQRVMRQTDDLIEPLALRQLAQAADLLEILDDGQTIRFSHQLLQEYFAALALEQKLAFLKQPHLQTTLRWQQQQSSWQRQLARYVAPGKRTGWEETLLLLAGLRENSAYLGELKAQLLSRPLEFAQLLCNDERDATLREEVRSAIQRQIMTQPFDQEQRLDLGRALGLLGDPRFPVSDTEWQRSLAQRTTEFTAEGEHYWRYVPAGRYRIGGWEDDEPFAEHELAPFWIARLPITVAQFARFVAEGYRDDLHWTPHGLAWHGERIAPYRWAPHGLAWHGERTTPYRWGDPAYSEPNQPVVFVTWYEATAYCHWLTTQLAAALPAGHVIRLPTEAEWEAAAACAGSEQRRKYPWGSDALTPERAIYDAWQLNAPVPVGLCPAGAAACGALDVVGNVWEWTSSNYQEYPDEANTLEKDFTPEEFDVPVRGGAYHNYGASVRCGARGWDYPDMRVDFLGLRVVVSPSIAQPS
jgi:formylglycine-generating enzyme required for sulfatase activity